MAKIIEAIKNFFSGKVMCKFKKKQEIKPPEEKPPKEKKPEGQK